MKKPPSVEESLFPMVISDRGVSAKIYRSVRTVAGRQYVAYWLVWQSPSGRQRRAFADLADAKREANAVLAAILSGRAGSKTISAADAELLEHAKKRAATVGKPLLALMDELKAANDILAGRASILDAARAWDKHNGHTKPISVAAAMKQYLAEKKRTLAPVSYRPISYRCDKFVAAFHCDVRDIERGAFRAWLKKLKASHKEHLEAVTTFLNWATAEDYIAKEAAAEIVRGVKVRKIESDAEIEIYSPEDIRKILTSDKAELGDILPCVVLCGFAGIRPDGELQRLDWSDVNLAEGHVEVRGSKAKTGSRRIVPLSANAAAWLTPWAKTIGAIAPIGKVSQAIKRHCGRVGVRFRQNGLRHSFGSYRLAVVKDAACVSLEMGNSTRMVFRHYHKATTEAQAAAFWSIMPG